MMKYYVIDIGSNSVRLMLWADGTTLYKRISTTRLGEGLALRPVLKAAAMERTARAVAEFAAIARADGEEPCAFATAAVRSAENGGEFCARVKALCGLAVDVVSGEREAALALSGALGKADGVVIDIGGGSTEICAREGGKLSLAVSFNVGAVRLFDLCHDDGALLATAVKDALLAQVHLPACGKVYAVGGTATTVAAALQGLKAYDAAKINDFPMSRAEVSALAGRLIGMTAEERRGAIVDPRRADIIAGGAYLLAAVMEKLRLERVYASDRDNLEGYLAEKVL